MGGQQRWQMRWFVLAVFLFTAGAGWFEAADSGGAFSLAILRRDGILLPFATFDGKHWENPWPTAGQKADVPILLRDTPKGWWRDKQPVLDWTLFPLFREVTARTAHVDAINWFRAGCQQAVGLFTDYKPAVLPPPPRVHPYPKDALAYAGDVKIEPIELASTTDQFASALLALLPEQITSKEDAMVQRYTSFRWTHSYSSQEREKTPIQIEALYRIPKGFSRDLYYFEAVKRYFLPKGKTPQQGATCDLVTFASGWFTATGSVGRSISDLGARVVVTSCDFANVNFMLPLGIVNVGERPQIIVQWSNATFESYMVMEAKAGSHATQPIEMAPRIETPGGACAAESDGDRN